MCKADIPDIVVAFTLIYEAVKAFFKNRHTRYKETHLEYINAHCPGALQFTTKSVEESTTIYTSCTWGYICTDVIHTIYV